MHFPHALPSCLLPSNDEPVSHFRPHCRALADAECLVPIFKQLLSRAAAAAISIQVAAPAAAWPSAVLSPRAMEHLRTLSSKCTGARVWLL